MCHGGFFFLFFPIFFAVMLIIGAFKLRRIRRMCAAGGHGGCGGPGRHGRFGRYGHHGGPDGRGPGGAGWGFDKEAWVKDALMRKLGLGEEHEATVELVIKDAHKAIDRFKADLKESRTQLADAVRGDTLDDARLAAVFEWHDNAAKEARKDLVEALRRLHAGLEPAQRARLGDLIATL